MYIGNENELKIERKRIISAYHDGLLDIQECLSQLDDIDNQLKG